MGMVDALSCDLQPKKWLNCTVQILARFRKGPASSSYSSRYQILLVAVLIFWCVYLHNWQKEGTRNGERRAIHLQKGSESYDRLRSLFYRQTDIVLICFSCDNLVSMVNVVQKWILEVKCYCRNAPVILVCNQVDLRTDQRTIEYLAPRKQHPVSYEEGCVVAQKIGAYAYLECSAVTGKGVKEVFEVAAHVALLPRKTLQKLEYKNLREKHEALRTIVGSFVPTIDQQLRLIPKEDQQLKLIPKKDKKSRLRFPWRRKPPLEDSDSSDVHHVINSGSTDTETLLMEAMQGGYVECNVAVILMVGVAGAGKTSFLQVVLNRPPLKTRKSTPLAKCAIRAVSISRAAVSEEGTVWKEITSSVLLEMVGDSITDDSLPTELPMESSLKSLPTSQAAHPHHVECDVDTGSVVVITKNVDAKQSSQDLASLDFQPPIAAGELSYKKVITKMKPVQQLIMYLKKSNRSGKIFEREWVYVADCGGQPQFIDLIPSYIRNVSGAAIFVKLNEELGSQPQIAYYSQEGKLCGKPYLSSLTHMQTIQNCLQVMQSRRTVSGEVECPELFFIGTHRDHEQSCKESLESKNAQLLEMLRLHETVNKHLSYYRLSKPEQLIYPVNAKKPKPKDHEVTREFREDVMKKCKKVKMKIPLRWFILEQQLQHVAQERNSAVLSLEDCQKIASDLEMDRPRLLAAIDYLDRLNLFKYLPKVLPNVVFTTSQVLLDKVSDLVELSHCLRGKSGKLTKSTHHVSDEDLVHFRDFGIVNIELLDQFPKHYVKGLFTSNELVLVLTNQLIFAQNGEGVFFMPCVLLELLLEKISEHQLDLSSALVSPLLVYYLGGLFPASIFNSLVAFLQNRSSWKVAMKKGQPACLYKNCIKFTHLKQPVTLTLIYSFDYMEVHAQFAVSDPQVLTKLSSELVDVLFNGLIEAATVQNYTNLQPSFGFFCSCEESRQSPHLAFFNSDNLSCLCCSKDDSCFLNISKSQQVWITSIMNEKSQEEAQSDVNSTYLTTTAPPTANESVMPALQLAANISATRTTTPEIPPLQVDVPTTNASISPLNSTSSPQLADNTSLSTAVPDITTDVLRQIVHTTQLSTEEHYSFLCEALENHAAKWKDIGRNLQFLPGELTNIEARPMLLMTAPKSFLHAMLQEWLQWAPGDHRGSKNFATLEALRYALSKSGLGVAAARLRVPDAVN